MQHESHEIKSLWDRPIIQIEESEIQDIRKLKDNFPHSPYKAKEIEKRLNQIKR
jgi:hypothetical protein